MPIPLSPRRTKEIDAKLQELFKREGLTTIFEMWEALNAVPKRHEEVVRKTGIDDEELRTFMWEILEKMIRKGEEAEADRY